MRIDLNFFLVRSNIGIDTRRLIFNGTRFIGFVAFSAGVAVTEGAGVGVVVTWTTDSPRFRTIKNAITPETNSTNAATETIHGNTRR